MRISNVVQITKAVIKKETDARPSYAVVKAIDGKRVDILVGHSKTTIKNVYVVGDVNSLTTGQRVQISWWDNRRPVVVAGGGSGDITISGTSITGMDAATLGGHDVNYFLSRSNHVGTQSPSTISPQGHNSSLDADMLDGQHGSYYVPITRQVVAGQGLAGGGALSGDVTLAISLAANSGLEISGGLKMGAPSTLSVSSANSISGTTHTHAITASADPGTAAALLKSTASGGLTLETFLSRGEVTALQSIYGAASSFRVIYHNHGGVDHAHVIINPTVGWSLDEQFGLDVNDNLLVRGWIVGKHAIQLDGAISILHFDGPPPWETDYSIGGMNDHMGRVLSTSGGVIGIGMGGKFGKAIQFGETSTNLMLNPSTETNTTNWQTVNSATMSRDASEAYIGSYSLKVDTAAIGNSGVVQGSPGSLGGSSQPYSVSVQIKAPSGSVTIFLRFSYTDASYEDLGHVTINAGGDWQYVATTATSSASKTLNSVSVHIRQPNAVAQTFWVDAIILTNTPYPVPYFDGSFGGMYQGIWRSGVASTHNWTGTAHGSTSTRTFSNAWLPNEAIKPAQKAGTIMAWVKSAISASYRTSSGTIYQIVSECNYSGANTGILWGFAHSPSEAAFRVWGIGATNGNLQTTIPTEMEWHHIAITWDGITVSLYVDGVLANTEPQSSTWTGFGSDNLSIGYWSTHSFNGWIDEHVVLDRCATADEIRAVAESNAPVFAETSTFQFRAAKNLFWADAEGVWMFDTAGNAVLGISGVDNKSWGGATLNMGDILFGHYGSGKGGWFKFDRDGQGSLGLLNLGFSNQEIIRFDSTGAYLIGSMSITGTLYAGSNARLKSSGLEFDYNIGTDAASVKWISGGSTFASITGKDLSGARGMFFVANRYEWFTGSLISLTLTNTALTLESSLDLILGDKIYTVDWTNYAGSSTVVGWSSFTTKVIDYIKVGKLVFVSFDIDGTSNSTSATFTLPSTSGVGITVIAPIYVVDSGNVAVAPGRITLNNGSATVTAGINMATSGGFTASGTKRILGQFWYISS